MSWIGNRYQPKTKDLAFVEEKGCITFSKVCVNLGKVADLKTGQEKYSCGHHFPEDCSKCGKLIEILNPQEWRLRILSERELKMLRDFDEEIKLKKWRKRAGTKKNGR